ncbi:MAG: 1-(5-phosphoribosyl)-5-[(5-phosphoribosylamino)methylideneamino]imidazole-4-carboxamide isomerase [Kiritimatiellae bacterium]|nr:1-(5-phosphoribosyl)-5-[(5-phosphoribosylamino)methylideneamino]imidazole-4-carboxamide isomerase [Kiritimatiellia bacterium]
MSPLVVLPAIDLRGGRCVRLRQGRAEDQTDYSADPVAVAREWVAQGARWLHVVDLDGAFEGRPVHTALIGEIVRAAGVPVEVGGGLRTDADIEATLAAGAARVILGTRLLESGGEASRLARWLGDRLAVGLDANEGRVRARGWTAETCWSLIEAARRLEGEGVRWLIVTDIGRDGMLGGVNTAAVAEVCDAVRIPVIASGGVASAEDVRALRGLNRGNLWGVIAGRALYEKTVSLPELLQAAER